MHSKVEQPKTKKETPKDVKGKPETQLTPNSTYL